MTLALLPDRIENPANLLRIDDAARLLGACVSSTVKGRLIALENTPGAKSIYGRRLLRSDATIAIGNERRGLSHGILTRADEVLVIPTQSRKIATLNVAAAAAVAGWYVLRGSNGQASTTRADMRRPSLFLVGDDHVEVGSSLRSAAAFGFRDVLLKEHGSGWFDGSAAVRREAYAAARRHKNSLRVHRCTFDDTARFEEIVVVVPRGDGSPLMRERLTHGARQLVVLGASPEEVASIGRDRVRIATLHLEAAERTPLRLAASIVMAEIARQVGRPRPLSGEPALGRLAYETAIPLTPVGDVLVIEPAQLLNY